MSKHTPGPWEVMDSFYPSIKEVVGPSFNVKAVMWATDLTEKDYQERLADLRLIAAAPELLEALREIEAGTQFWDSYPIEHPYGKAKAAIAKATGKA